jgi:hypothetical protein
MNLYRAKFHYFCLPARHENHVTRYYRALDVDDVERRLPIPSPCSQCPTDAVPDGRLEIDFEVEEISETEFAESGGRLEPDIA